MDRSVTSAELDALMDNKELAHIAVERGCGRLEWWCLDWNQSSIDSPWLVRIDISFVLNLVFIGI